MAVSKGSLAAELRRARQLESAGPSVLLALAALASSSDARGARIALTEQLRVPSARATLALKAARLLAEGLSAPDPLTFLTGSPSGSTDVRLLDALFSIEAGAAEATSDRVSYLAVRMACAKGEPRRVALAASKSGDGPSKLAAAALIAAAREHCGDSFAGHLYDGLHLPVVPSTGTRGAHGAARVLLGAYALDARRRAGLDLGTESWNGAPAGWRASVAPWLLPIINVDAPRAAIELLVAMRLRGLKVARPGEPPFPLPSKDAGLALGQKSALDAAVGLTRWFDRPMWFDGGPGNIQVLLTQDDLYGYAWVGMNGRGVLVSFDTDLFIGYGLNDAAVRHAVGIAVAWYVDVSISLRRTPAGTLTVTRKSAKGPKAAGYRYVPTPTHGEQRYDVIGGARKPPQPHWVVPSVRRLSVGSQPSEEQRSLAPMSLKRRMGPNDTFVRGHTRGGHVAEADWLKRLSKHSLLADVLGVMERST